MINKYKCLHTVVSTEIIEQKDLIVNIEYICSHCMLDVSFSFLLSLQQCKYYIEHLIYLLNQWFIEEQI